MKTHFFVGNTKENERDSFEIEAFLNEICGFQKICHELTLIILTLASIRADLIFPEGD